MLFHNNHDGTFTDVTDKAGVANERWGLISTDTSLLEEDGRARVSSFEVVPLLHPTHRCERLLHIVERNYIFAACHPPQECAKTP
jgi:hypothetical protein